MIRPEGSFAHEFAEIMLLCPILIPAILLLAVAVIGILRDSIEIE